MRPLLYAAILGLIFTSTFNNSLIWLSCFFIAVALRDMIFGNQKFLSKLTIAFDHIIIEYIDGLLRTKHLDASIDENKNIVLSDMKSITDYPANLIFSDNDNIQKFTILNKSIWKYTDEALNAANIGLPKATTLN